MSAGADWSRSFGGLVDAGGDAYADILVPRLFAPWAERLADLLELSAGERVLDVACGPGTVSRAAARRLGPEGLVAAVDLSPTMLARATAWPAPADAASITYLEASADALPVPDAAFDAAACQQGLQFFPDRPRALAEIYRALRPGGRAGIAVWSELERSPLFFALGEAIGEVAGAELAEGYRGGPWGLPDVERVEALLGEAGFREVEIRRETISATFEGGPRQLVATLATTPLAGPIEALGAPGLEALVAALARRVGEGPLEGGFESHLALAWR